MLKSPAKGQVPVAVILSMDTPDTADRRDVVAEIGYRPTVPVLF